MPKWSQQEQRIFLLGLFIFLTGVGGRLWLRSQEANSAAQTKPLAVSSPASTPH